MTRKFKLYPRLRKDILYKIISRLFIGLIFSLVYNKFSNRNPSQIGMDRIFFFIAILFLTASWIHYLKLDGMAINIVKKSTEDHKKNKGGIIEYLDEEVKDIDLDERDEIIAGLIANLVSFAIFSILTIIALH